MHRSRCGHCLLFALESFFTRLVLLNQDVQQPTVSGRLLGLGLFRGEAMTMMTGVQCWRSISAREWVDGEACQGDHILCRFDGGPFVRRSGWTDIVVDASISDHPGFAHTHDA